VIPLLQEMDYQVVILEETAKVAAVIDQAAKEALIKSNTHAGERA